ncbi:hypothetical protein B9Q02_11070 [Candidatus Marsarchaeota G1 archaeon BE_D]|jgi:Bacterial extracellular solute-binding proteins, family 5 Middle.|uniref:Solute-binding protein family 5 domain-containing protein n=1 Tax=Candidatus Marsarchaeota G1 archaeon BE_D TaxID=1978156 RepID=A0A2R6A9I5_9ARCH|nr:MAG: hypothetical protein B9Q02_11070 [Candidatus Marsarchaeota G1 archaeon BE_D]
MHQKIVILFILLLLFSFCSLAKADEPALPPFSIYGTPTPPSNLAILNRTGEYWGPYIQSIYITWFTTDEAEIEALVNGYIQFDGAGVSNLQEYQQLLPYALNGEIGLNFTPYNGFYFIGFKYNEYPFNNTYFREAIQRLVNYQQVATAFANGILGIASPYYLLPILYSEYFTPEQQQAYLNYGEFNLSAAILDLEKAGLVDHPSLGYWSYSNGTKVSFEIYVPTADLTLNKNLVNVLISNAALINLTINMVVVDTNTFIYALLPSESMEMYIVSVGFGPPPEPSWTYFLLGPAPLNEVFIHYYDPTAWTLIKKLYYDSYSISLAKEYANEVTVFLQENVPVVILGWLTTLVPVSLVGWRGYILQNGVGYAFPANVHPLNSTFGGLYRFGDSFAVNDLNIYTQVSGADYAALNMMWLTPLTLSYSTSDLFPLAVYNWSITRGEGVMPNGHFYNGSVIALHFLHNIVWQDGAPLTAIDLNFTIWYMDAGGFMANPYNSSQDVIQYAPGVSINLTARANDPSSEWFGYLPSLAGTYVPPNDPYTLYIYLNSTSIFSFYSSFPALWTEPILPEHTMYNVSVKQYTTESPAEYLSQQVMAGPYMFESWNPILGYVLLRYFPSYVLANPYSNYYSVVQGSTINFTINATVFADHVVQSSSGYTALFNKVDNGEGFVYVINPSTQKPIEVFSLTNDGNGEYSALISANLSPGVYYLIAQVNWTGSPYYYYYGTGSLYQNEYSYHVYGVLNVSAKSVTSTQTTITSSTTSTSLSVSTSTMSQISHSSTSYYYYVLIALVLAVVLAVIIFALRRK